MFGIRSRLLLFGVLTWIVVFAVYNTYIYTKKIDQMKRSALSTASALSSQIMANREIYASSVVERALTAGLQVSGSFADTGDAIPEHITNTGRVTGSSDKQGQFYVTLVSDNPLNKANKVRDTFQFDALKLFASGSDTKYYNFEKYNGSYSIRYIVPDFATSSTCIRCHNNHANASVKDLKLGSILGALEVIVPMQDERATIVSELKRSLLYALGAVTIIALMGMIVLGYLLSAPVASLRKMARSVADGDLTELTAPKGSGELGALGRESASATENIRTNMMDIQADSGQLIDTTACATETCRVFLKEAYTQDSALGSVHTGMDAIKQTTTEIGKGTLALTATSERGVDAAHEIVSAIFEVAESMDLLTSGLNESLQNSEELNISTREVSDEIEKLSVIINSLAILFHETGANREEADKKAFGAIELAKGLKDDVKASLLHLDKALRSINQSSDVTQDASKIILALSERVVEIGKILEVISASSDETNILALNASIIATKSGRYGKSFSIVAGEITELAERTSTSAKEVSKIINSVQVEGQRAFDTMQNGLSIIAQGVSDSVSASEGLKRLSRNTTINKDNSDSLASLTSKISRETRSVSDSLDKMDEVCASIINGSRDNLKEFALLGRTIERLKDVSFRIKENIKDQVSRNKAIALSVGDVSRMVLHINEVVHSQNLLLTKTSLPVESAMDVLSNNIETAKETEKALERLVEINIRLRDNIAKFKI